MRIRSRRGFIIEGFSAVGAAALAEAGAGSQSLQSVAPAPKFKLGLVTYNLAKDWDIETIIKNCEATGFEGVELRTTHAHGVEPSISQSKRAEVRKRFEDSKVKLVSLGTACEFQSPDDAVVRKNVDLTRQFCELARDLGCLGVKVRPNGFPPDSNHEKVLAQIGHALAECGEIAQSRGVEIWLEVHGRETQLPSNIRRIMEACGQPAVGVCWNSNPTDVANGSVKANFELLKPWLRSCHITNLESAGYPWHELFTLFREAGYSRYTFCEVGEPSCEPVRFMNYYRALWDYTAGIGRP
ncbi:MAG: sugar phosphate isomerase/epimerase family protein [Deltaproteobacteria bacterium]